MAGGLTGGCAVPVPAPSWSEGVVPGMKVHTLRLVGYYAFTLNDGQDLIGGMDMRSGSGAIVEEDGNDLQFPALLFRDQVMHVNRPLEVFRVRESSDRSVGL